MKKNILIAKKPSKEISEKDVNSMLKQVRDFQEQNQKYLVKPPYTAPEVKPTIINMASTNY